MTAEFDVGASTLRVDVYDQGELVAQVECETAQEAAEVVAEWEEREGVECEVEDLSGHHEATDVLAPEPEDAF